MDIKVADELNPPMPNVVYDAVIMDHSQFERIPISQERQERLLQEQISRNISARL